MSNHCNTLLRKRNTRCFNSGRKISRILSNVAWCSFFDKHALHLCIAESLAQCLKLTRRGLEEGIIKSPGYPFRLYPSNLQCNYYIKPPKNFIVIITFAGFYLQGRDEKGRLTDYVQVRFLKSEARVWSMKLGQTYQQHQKYKLTRRVCG